MTGTGFIFPEQMANGQFTWFDDLAIDGGGPLDAPDLLPAGATRRHEEWSGCRGSAWPAPMMVGR
ncbi:MAG: hypothetical protein Q8O25_08255 [Sulfurisoma sp.]|nr:hypothetical protein [Sulfurisoma sp.]